MQATKLLNWNIPKPGAQCEWVMQGESREKRIELPSFKECRVGVIQLFIWLQTESRIIFQCKYKYSTQHTTAVSMLVFFYFWDVPVSCHCWAIQAPWQRNVKQNKWNDNFSFDLFVHHVRQLWNDSFLIFAKHIKLIFFLYCTVTRWVCECE